MSARRWWFLGMLCVLVTLAAACDQSKWARGSVLQSGADNAPLVLTGQLRSVDPDKRTLRMAFGDDLYEFAYTDSTEVVGGTANARGLTGNTGNQITVHYRANPITSTKTAVRIELQ